MASKFTSPEKKPPTPEIFDWADIEEIDLQGLSSDEDTEEIKASHAQLSFERSESPEPSPEQSSLLLQQKDTKSWHLKLPKFGRRSKLYQVDETRSPTKKTKSISPSPKSHKTSSLPTSLKSSREKMVAHTPGLKEAQLINLVTITEQDDVPQEVRTLSSMYVHVKP